MQRISLLEATDGMMFIDNPIDIYYLTGAELSKGVLFIFPKKSVLFVDSRYIDICKKIDGIDVKLDEKDHIKTFLSSQSISKVYVDGRTLTFSTFKSLEKWMPTAEFIQTDRLNKVRSVKDDNEVKKMYAAGKLNHQAMLHTISSLKEGVTEKEIAWEYEKFCRERGGDSLSFDTIIAFGKNSAYPHYHTGSKRLEKGMPVLIDCGITVDSYTSDMTRTLFFEKDGNYSDYLEWKNHYDLVKKSYDLAYEKAEIGVMFSSLDDEVHRYCKEKEVGTYLRHSLGHGLGLDVHEWPRISQHAKGIEIKENMFFTIEPGLYFEGKWGIRYENTIHMKKSGPVVISKG